jgi:iron complex transport system substrate-binding protein
MAKKARLYPTNSGRAEELLALKPDLILASQYTDPGLVNLLRKLKLRVETFPLTATIEDIRHAIMHMAKLLGRAEQGKALIEQMDRRLAKIAKNPPARRPRGAFYQPNGYTSGSGTLQDVALTLAGWDNIAARLGVKGYGSIDLERLLMAKPEQLFNSAYAPGTQSLAQQALHHPALIQITQGRDIINIGYKYWICGGPMIADAVELLHRSLPQ